MFFPLSLSDLTDKEYSLTLQLLSIALILIMLVYIGLSAKESE
jgi:hypothetical protein